MNQLVELGGAHDRPRDRSGLDNLLRSALAPIVDVGMRVDTNN